MKKIISIFIVLFLICITLSGCSCVDNWEQEKIDRISQVKSELNYGIITYSRDKVFIDDVEYDYVVKVEEILNKKINNNDALHNISQLAIVEDDLFFTYKTNGKRYENSSLTAYDMFLFYINLRTGECKLISQYIDMFVGNMHIGNGLIIILNKTELQIFDAKTKEFIYEIEVFKKELITHYQGQNLPYHFNEFNDLIVKQNNILMYYEFMGDSYKLHNYYVNEDVSDSDVQRYKNFIYTSKYMGGNIDYVYYECYDLNTDTEIDVNTILPEITENKNQEYETETNNRNKFYFNGKKYYYKENSFYDEQAQEEYYSLTLLNENKEELVVINDNYMREKCQAYIDLYDLYTVDHSEYSFGFYTINNKLFITTGAEILGLGNRTPTYLYEYDIDNETVKYFTFVMKNYTIFDIYEKQLGG